MKQTIPDARGAILVARALMRAQHGGEVPYSEKVWLERCQARLKDGVWSITEKGPHKPRTGYVTGAAVIFIGADDGRFLGELFLD